MWNANNKVLAQELALYKGENGDRMQRLERSNVSVVITLRGLQRSVDALATKEGVRALEHHRRRVPYLPVKFVFRAWLKRFLSASDWVRFAVPSSEDRKER